MPPLEVMDLRQKAVLWREAGYDDHGQRQVYEPEELRVRWVSSSSESITGQETSDPKDATVITTTDVPLGSIMRLGTLASVPDTPDELMVVIRRSVTPCLKNRHTRYELSLNRYSAVLPTIVED